MQLSPSLTGFITFTVLEIVIGVSVKKYRLLYHCISNFADTLFYIIGFCSIYNVPKVYKDSTNTSLIVFEYVSTTKLTSLI